MLPKVEALVLCERIHKEDSSGRHSLIGTFNDISLSVFPASVNFEVFLAMSGARTSVRVRLRLVWLAEDDADGETLGELPPIDIPADPLGHTEAVFRLEEVPIRGLGECRIRVLCGNSTIAEKRLTVREL